ncbi:hypothetical protein IV498_02270 [Paenarthrobacter sp. Z7-10]|uniref:hypothetical protein n=1 Tax=Paenarthrobacter sp. Z7-10 TaxID=2787635 RepID=UPI0022A9EBF5|nr:hypothetical protein [Paenarthrobacter sp. Z7-10]MCZ2402037.1 hypothetical protein [Paenarthrobacter sp. Z7-10]
MTKPDEGATARGPADAMNGGTEASAEDGGSERPVVYGGLKRPADGGSERPTDDRGSEVLFSADGTMLGLAGGRLFGARRGGSMIWPDGIEGKVARAVARKTESCRAKEARNDLGE